MKKTTTLPDGSVEVIEGTSQELAEFEKAKDGEQADGTKKESKVSKKRVLLSEEDVRRVIAEELAKAPQTHWHFCAGCAHCQPKVVEPFSPYTPGPIWYQITTSDTIKIDSIPPQWGTSVSTFDLKLQN